MRTGAVSLAKAAAAKGGSYSALLAAGISGADAEQIALDVCRSGVDELERIAPASHDAALHRQAIERLLRAWCARNRRSGYCQGMNFIASVLLAVMGHAALDSRESRKHGSQAPRQKITVSLHARRRAEAAEPQSPTGASAEEGCSDGGAPAQSRSRAMCWIGYCLGLAPWAGNMGWVEYCWGLEAWAG